MKIMGVDPSMQNTGIQVLDIKPEAVTSEIPEWIKKKGFTGTGTYGTLVKIFECTLKQQDTSDHFIRIQKMANDVIKLINLHKPDILSIESQLNIGENKSTSGYALQNLILQNYTPLNRNFVRLINGEKEWIPRCVITIRPERVQSLNHAERSTTGHEVVRRYKELTKDTTRVSQHSADAYFIAYSGYRFWAAVLANTLPTSYLTSKEQDVFINGPSSMKVGEYYYWWDNLADAE